MRIPAVLREALALTGIAAPADVVVKKARGSEEFLWIDWVAGDRQMAAAAAMTI